MSLIKMMWPSAFQVKEKDTLSFLVNLTSFVILMVVFCGLMWLLSGVPFLRILMMVIGIPVEFYALVGILLVVLRFFGVVKRKSKKNIK